MLDDMEDMSQSAGNCQTPMGNSQGFELQVGPRQTMVQSYNPAPSGWGMFNPWTYANTAQASGWPQACFFNVNQSANMCSPSRVPIGESVSHSVPQWTSAPELTIDQKAKIDEFTTVMLRNLPNDYTRDMLLELLQERGFYGHFDFVYLPFDFKKRAGLGYAFLNLVNHQAAVCAMAALAGYCAWKVKSNKVLQVTWSTQVQGLKANIERYKNSPVMHPDVPERFKPMIFVSGIPTAFPPPTKVIQAP
jgi:hypothetical protein